MSARFNFAIAEAQEKIQDEAFMDKVGIGDYMTVLASGLKEGLQEKERQELEAEKLKKAEDAKLRQKQVAADKLAKEIDSTVNLVLETNGLNTSLAPKLTQILKNNGSANGTLIQGYIDSIDNINEFMLDAPVNVDAQMDMIIPKPTFKNRNLSDIGSMDLGNIITELEKVNKESNPKRYKALIKRQAALQSGSGTFTDDYYLNGITRGNISSFRKKLDRLYDEDTLKYKQYKRLIGAVGDLEDDPAYQDLGKDDIFKNSDGKFKSKEQIERMLNDSENMAKLTDDQRTRGISLITPPSDKKPVSELNVTTLISERQLLTEQDTKTDEDKIRLANLNSAYNALVAAGKIDPVKEEVFDAVSYVGEMPKEEKKTTLLLLQEKQRLGTLEAREQKTLSTLEFLNKADGEFTKLDKRVLKDYSNTASDRATLDITIENVTERLASYVKDKSGLSADRFESYTDELVRLKIIQSAFELDDKVKSNDVSVDLTNDYTTIKIGTDKGVTDVRLTKKGNFYVVSGTRAGQVIERTSTDYQQDSVGPTTSQVEALSKLINRNDDFFSELTDLKNDSSKLVQSSYELLEFVGRNENILTVGAAASFVESVLVGTEAIFEIMANTNSLMSEQQVVAKAKESALKKFEEAVKNDASLKGTAALYDQFISLSLRHAFQFAKLDLGSSGQALSNFDFKNSLRINNTGSTYPVFATNILNQTSALIRNAANKFDDKLNTDAEHTAALNSKLYSDTFEKTGIKVGGVKSFLETNNEEAYTIFKTWEDSNGSVLPPPKPAQVNSNTSNTPPAQLNEIANAQEAADSMNKLNTDGLYTEFVKNPNNASKMGTTASALAKLVYKTGQPTPEMITHATNWLKALQQ